MAVSTLLLQLFAGIHSVCLHIFFFLGGGKYLCLNVIMTCFSKMFINISMSLPEVERTLFTSYDWLF